MLTIFGNAVQNSPPKLCIIYESKKRQLTQSSSRHIGSAIDNRRRHQPEQHGREITDQDEDICLSVKRRG